MTEAAELPRETGLAGHFRDIHSLTALRGLAALLVVVYHFSGSFLPVLDLASHSGIISKAYLRVDFFFLLSGFILVDVYGDRFSAAMTWPTVREFIFARLARIYPLHLTILMGFLALELVKLVLFDAGLVEDEPFRAGRTMEALASNVALVQTAALHGELTWNGPAWSISAEWFAYLVFPAAVVLILSARRCHLPVIAALAMVGLYLISDGGRDLDVTVDFGVLRCVFGFLIGMVLYRVWSEAECGRLSSDLPGLAAAMLLLLAMHMRVMDILIPPLFALLLLALAGNRGWLHRALSTRWLVWLGTISCSVYLSHMLVLDVSNTASRALVGQRFGRNIEAAEASMLALVAGIVVVLALSQLLYRWVERPARDVLKRSSFAKRFIYIYA